MKKIIVVAVLSFITLLTIGCRQQESKQQPVTYTPAMPPAVSQIEQMRQAAEVAPKSAAAWINLGNVLMDAKNFSEAINAYDKALVLDPKNVPVLVDQGTCYRGVGNFNKAIEQYRKAIKIDPNFPNGHRNLGVVLAFDLNQKAEGVKEIKRYLELEPAGQGADSARQALKELTAGK